MARKIGIVSLPKYYNYGTQLQLYALQASIENLGYSCEVVNYVKNFKATPSSLSKRIFNVISHPYRLPVGLVSRLYTFYNKKLNKNCLERSIEFERQFIHLGRTQYSSSEELENNPPKYDAFVVGSDQVWHPVGHLGENAYFLTFADPRIRIAYAPSLGVSVVPRESVEWLRNGLLGMRFLSAREKTGVKLIKELSGRSAEVVVDPTLLISSEHWKTLMSEVDVPDKYILVYALCGDSYIREFCKMLSAKLDCSIVVLPKHPRDVLWFSPKVNRAFDIGPREFLYLLSKAHFVITDSFHGSVFSIQFHRPFYSFKRYDDVQESANFSRIADLLHTLGIHERIVTKESIPKDPLVSIDYDNVDKNLNAWKTTSRTYLSNSLMSEQNC